MGPAIDSIYGRSKAKISPCGVSSKTIYSVFPREFRSVHYVRGKVLLVVSVCGRRVRLTRGGESLLNGRKTIGSPPRLVRCDLVAL